MPSQDDIEKAKTRREQRKAAREAAVETAHTQEAAISDAIAKGKAAPAVAPAVKPTTPKTRKQHVEAARVAAEKKAAEQEQRVTSGTVDLAPFKVRSYDNPPLHVLNQMAREAEVPIRRAARAIANAAGKAAFDAANGRTQQHKGHDRIARVAAAQAAKEKQAAAKTGE